MATATLLSHRITFNLARAQRAAVEVLVAFGIMLGAVTLARCGSGCARPPTPPTPAEVEYTSELGKCVDDAGTRAESRKCRDDVSRRYGLCVKIDGVEKCP